MHVGGEDGVDVTEGYVSDEFASATGDKAAGEGENYKIDSDANGDLNAAAELGQGEARLRAMSGAGATVGAGSFRLCQRRYSRRRHQLLTRI